MGTRPLVETVRDVLVARGDVLEAYVFGSHARGDARPHSDVDVAVYLDATAPSDDPWGADATIAADLMAALRSSRVDVVVLNRAPPLIYHRVLRDGIRVLARDLRATTVREGQALSRACDFLPHLKSIDDALRERLRRGAYGR
jgi:predicted nucleotidyltransferase